MGVSMGVTLTDRVPQRLYPNRNDVISAKVSTATNFIAKRLSLDHARLAPASWEPPSTGTIPLDPGAGSSHGSARQVGGKSV